MFETVSMGYRLSGVAVRDGVHECGWSVANVRERFQGEWLVCRNSVRGGIVVVVVQSLT